MFGRELEQTDAALNKWQASLFPGGRLYSLFIQVHSLRKENFLTNWTNLHCWGLVKRTVCAVTSPSVIANPSESLNRAGGLRREISEGRRIDDLVSLVSGVKHVCRNT